MTTDSRTTLILDGMAAQGLEGVVAAERFAATEARVCVAPAAGVHRAPERGAEQMDQLLYGEGFDVLRVEGGWAFGQARRDGYVGYVELPALADAGGALPSHRVSVLRTYAFADPSIKTRALGPYSLNALVAAGETEGRFVRDALGGGWFVAAHLAPIGLFEADPVAVAERFLGAPYLWGGRGSLGLDCSGLVQQAFAACGVALPRDTDQQEAATREIARTELGRGDLVFWKGHVAMMLDAERIIHANAFHMMTAVEPLAGAIERIAAGGTPTSSFRRVI